MQMSLANIQSGTYLIQFIMIQTCLKEQGLKQTYKLKPRVSL